jgi:hypothetical protein
MNDVKIAPERFIHVPVFRPFGKFFGVFRRLNPGTAVVLVVTNHLTIILPLPAGEGRGEGEPFGSGAAIAHLIFGPSSPNEIAFSGISHNHHPSAFGPVTQRLEQANHN